MHKETANYAILNGNSPFLISAPHAKAHKRPTLTGIYKKEESFTDLICQEVCRDTDSSGIYTIKELEYDPNFFGFENNEYKKEIKRICEEGKKKNFLDIHGLNDKYDYDIGIYYLSHFGKSKRIARDLRDSLGKGNLKGLNVHIFRFPSNDQETLSEFVASKLRVPALQIEIVRYLREEEDLRESLVKNLSSFLNSF